MLKWEKRKSYIRIFQCVYCILYWIFSFILNRSFKVPFGTGSQTLNYICPKKINKKKLKTSDMSESLESTYWTVTFSFYSFVLLFFLSPIFQLQQFLKICNFIFEKGFNSFFESFIICYISYINIAKEWLLCFFNKSKASVTLLVTCEVNFSYK